MKVRVDMSISDSLFSSMRQYPSLTYLVKYMKMEWKNKIPRFLFYNFSSVDFEILEVINGSVPVISGRFV